ncbi:MAG: LysR family transcriptional regulator [Hyphomicrobium sp.]|jgi:DNA-binding transcriptional LysR family regulator|uniref:LysR family transcriptional regulator n=1 Tax=Hyphomicrobium sp. TaxID=82 RepID=UPI0025B9C4CC|nr:LysR family transcriptional regulator [Hyphomicrobium sp.]MBX9865069.1 LysR family transcriptional regulator [Hyphomicrobium sp.]
MLNEIDLSRTDLNLLVLFEAVLRERHVGRAAERLNLSPSAISHGLGRLRRVLNDPLFLRTPKGVVPTERATELARPIADILAQVRSVLATAEPFDPRSSGRRFTIGAPDGVSAAILPALLQAVRREGPLIDIALRQLLPEGGVPYERAWQPALDALEARVIDVAIVPIHETPARFTDHVLYEEEFVIAARAKHPYARSLSLKRFCETGHLLVSMTGDAHGFVDASLAERGLKRRIELTVPNFSMALAIIAECDLIAALPKKLVAAHAARFGIVAVKSPLPARRDKIRSVASNAALRDGGVAWLFELLQKVSIPR